MKKVLLVGVNAKYIHSNLAIRSLKAYVSPRPISICDLTINDSLKNNLAFLMDNDVDVYGFSCYIFNIEYVLKLAELVKKSRPEIKILFGGPEVSFDADELLSQYDYIDYVIPGEGELIFKSFLEAMDDDDLSVEDVLGVFSRKNNNHHLLSAPDLDQLPFPYDEQDLIQLKNRIIYYESMRGCPFKCAYCLSSTVPSVRLRNLETVFHELDRFIEYGVKQVKFVDRTFNLHLERTKKIIRFLSDKNCITNFHFEIAADILDEELIELISQAPKGRFQFEIGIQSTNEKTLSEITRKTDIEKLSRNIHALLRPDNAHIHVDLIAGLPNEDYVSFQCSFNDAIRLRPHMLQLGFLKLLKGTRLRREYEKYHYQFSSFPPYEVISNAWISAEELRILKKIDAVVDKFYNSGLFKRTFDWIAEKNAYDDWFDFFRNFCDYLTRQQFFNRSLAQKQLFVYFADYLKTDPQLSKGIDMIRLDALRFDHSQIPKEIMFRKVPMPIIFNFAKDESIIEEVFPDLSDEAPKNRVKKFNFCALSEHFSESFKHPVAIYYDQEYCFFDETEYTV